MAAALKSSSSGRGAAVAAASPPPAHREVAIFWDYENLRLPGSVEPADASKLIVEAVSARLRLHADEDGRRIGDRIVDRRLYFDFRRETGQHFSALDSTGFDLVNTPSRNQKETLDKKLIADVLTFAWDSAVRNTYKPCVVLLTSDGDYAYTLSKLRDRGIMSFVVHGDDASVARVLKSSADVLFNFETDILKKLGATATSPETATNSADVGSSSPPKSRTSRPGSPPSLITTTTTTNASASLDSPEDNDGSVTLGSGGITSSPSRPVPHLFIKNVTRTATIRELVSYLEKQADGLVVEHAFTVLPGGLNPPYMFAQVKMQTSTQAATLCDIAQKKKGGMLFVDRQISIGYNSKPFQYKGSPQHYYERKVGDMGEGEPSVPQRSLAAGAPTAAAAAAAEAKSILFIKNVPTSVPLRQLVQHLESQDAGIRIVKASTRVSTSPKRQWTKNARVQFVNGGQASRMLELKKPVFVANRPLEIVWDRTGEPIVRGSSAYAEYYEPFREKEEEESVSTAASLPAAARDILLLCRFIGRLAEKTGVPNSWVYHAQLGAALKRVPPLESKEHCQRVQARACRQGLVEFGRRRSKASLEGIDVFPPNAPFDKDVYALDTFFRLTHRGAAYVASNGDTVGTEKTSPSELSQSKGTHLFCRALLRCSRTTKMPDSWCNGTFLRIALRELSKDDYQTKEDYQKLRTEVSELGLIETGRRRKDSGVIVNVTGIKSIDLHPEAYYRLTPKGKAHAENPSTGTSKEESTPKIPPDLLDHNAGDSQNAEAPSGEDDLLNLSERFDGADEKDFELFADLIDLSMEIPNPPEGDRNNGNDANQSPLRSPTNGS